MINFDSTARTKLISNSNLCRAQPAHRYWINYNKTFKMLHQFPSLIERDNRFRSPSDLLHIKRTIFVATRLL